VTVSANDPGPGSSRAVVGRAAWARDGYAHITVNQSIGAAGVDALERELEAAHGVTWAAYNGILRRVVVRFDPAATTLAKLTTAVQRFEQDIDRGQTRATGRALIPDIAQSTANTVALGADLLSIGAAMAGKALRLPRLPAELAALTAAVEHLPGLRARLGAARTDLGVALASSAIGAASQTILGSATNAGLRVLLLSESRAHRDAMARRANELYPDAEAVRADAPPPEFRPSPLPDGPIEHYARRLSTVTLLAAGAMLWLPRGRRRSARALAVGSPRAARIGREAYASQLGRVLARRGVVVRDDSALRRLDRVDTVIIDAQVLTTGRSVVTHVVPVRGSVDGVRDRVAWLTANAPLAGGRSRRPVTRGGWAMTPPSSLDTSLSADLVAMAQESGSGRGDVFALTRRGVLIALVRVEAELDPRCAAMIAAARKVGRVLVAGAAPDVLRRLRPDGTVPGGSRLAGSVRALQQEHCGVALVAARNDVALAGADCGIGIVSAGANRPPWGGHVLCGPGLENAWLVLESATLARQVSRRSARIALLGTVAGAILGLADGRPPAGRRALAATAMSALANLAGGIWSASELGRRPVPVPEELVPWHALPIDEVFRLLDGSPSGLSDEQASQRRSQSNDQQNGERGLLATAMTELDTPLTVPLAAGAGISAAAGSMTDAALVLSVIVANALLSGAQEVTAKRMLRRLLTDSALRVRLYRAGESRLTSAEDLVPGDVVSFETGDAVPADCRIITAVGLEMDESSLTGESTPVAKSEAPTLAVTIVDRTSMLYAGTTVAAGNATAVVVATGRSTQAGRSEHMIVEDVPTGGVQARLRTIATASIPVSAAAAAGLFLGGIARGRVAESVNSAVALAVAAIPEGLPFVATAAELSASKRLARRNILVRNHRAMEALGRVDTVCFDKTGTLTEGRIELVVVSDGRSHEPVQAAGRELRRVVAAALRASPVPDGGEILPHPTDRAVVTGAEDVGVTAAEGLSRWRMVRELPFEPGRGFHAVLGEVPTGQLISVKGAPEIVLPRCGSWRLDGRTRVLAETDRSEIEAEVDRLARQGLRVLAVAERRASRRRDLGEERVDRLELRGLLALADVARPTAAEAVQRLRSAGVNVIMLTGDHPSTAEAIGAELDLLDGGTVVTGTDLADAESDEAILDALVSKAAVFARVSPAHKVAVVRSLQRAGHVVAVTGDGANDAPAIRLADVGIALGDRGTTAARQAADMIVVDGRIETIADGVIEGRAMWASVRDAVALLLGGNLGEILFAVVSSAMSPRPPLKMRQILFVNLMTDLLPALTVASRSPRGVTPDELVREGPESSLGADLTLEVARRAAATALATTGGWLMARATGTRSRASSVAVASLVGSQLAQTAVASRGDPAVLGAVGLSLGALAFTVQTPVVSHFFGCRPLGPVGWGIVLGSTAGGAAIGAIPIRHVQGLVRVAERARAAGLRLWRSDAAKPEKGECCDHRDD
jgi:cation-transporting P-type ATPase I